MSTSHRQGVSIWLDDLSRGLLERGTLAHYVAEQAVSGVTAHPANFVHALRRDERYRDRLARLVDKGLREPHALFFALALADVYDAAHLLHDTYERTGGRDGYVSFACTPDVAGDATATVRQAQHVWERVDAPNLMIAVPATAAGIEAIEQLTAEGINVNATLLFSVDRYEQAARAYQRGIGRRARAGAPVAQVRSVASVFVSVAIADARAIHRRATAIFDEPGWNEMRARGARPQRLLWAGTAPKAVGVRDVAGVDALALPDTIVAVPETTLSALVARRLPRRPVGAGDDHAAAIAEVGRPGQDLAELEAAGLRASRQAYDEVISYIDGYAMGRTRGEAA